MNGRGENSRVRMRMMISLKFKIERALKNKLCACMTSYENHKKIGIRTDKMSTRVFIL